MIEESNADNQASESKEPEKMIPNSRVQELLHERTKAVAAKAREQALAEAEEKYKSQSSMGGMSQMSDDKIRQLVAEGAKQHLNDYLQQQQQQMQQAHGEKVANEFNSKLAAAKDRIPDYNDTIGQLDMREIPHIALLANTVDNTADVMHELAKNPSKIASLMTLVHTSPKLAQAEMKRLSQSIEVNKQAANSKGASEPLSHVQPSTTGTDNGSPTSIKDMRKLPFMRA